MPAQVAGSPAARGSARWKDTWSPVHTESKPSASTRRGERELLRAMLELDAKRMGFRPRGAGIPAALTGKGVLDAAVHGERAAGGLGRAVGGQEEHGLGHVLGQDARAEEVALAVEVLELVDRDALRARARSRRISSDQSFESRKTASGFTMLERMPCGPPSSASTLASCASAALEARVGREVLARRHHVLGGHEDEARRRAPAAFSTRMRLARHQEVARRVHRERALPVGQRHAVHRRGVRDARVGHDDVEAAVGVSTVASNAAAHRGLAGHVHAEAERRGRPPTAATASSATSPRARRVEIGHHHVRALGGQALGDRAADAAGAPGDERDPAGQLLLGRRQRELVELERPVLDVEGVLGGERDVAAEGGGRAA